MVQTTVFLVSISTQKHDLCACEADVSRKSSRYRSMPACAHREKLYHMGIRSRISRSTLADANEGTYNL
jgi:hypothetical protein